MIVALSAEHADFGTMPLGIMEIAEARRRYPHLRYSYAIRMGEDWHPLG